MSIFTQLRCLEATIKEACLISTVLNGISKTQNAKTDRLHSHKQKLHQTQRQHITHEYKRHQNTVITAGIIKQTSKPDLTKSLSQEAAWVDTTTISAWAIPLVCKYLGLWGFKIRQLMRGAWNAVREKPRAPTSVAVRQSWEKELFWESRESH